MIFQSYIKMTHTRTYASRFLKRRSKGHIDRLINIRDIGYPLSAGFKVSNSLPVREIKVI